MNSVKGSHSASICWHQISNTVSLDLHECTTSILQTWPLRTSVYITVHKYLHFLMHTCCSLHPVTMLCSCFTLPSQLTKNISVSMLANPLSKSICYKMHHFLQNIKFADSLCKPCSTEEYIHKILQRTLLHK